MSFEALLTALDGYIGIKKEMEADRPKACDDWDCGIAGEFDGQFISESHQEQLRKAKVALEIALNRYVDARVASVLKAE